MKNRTSNLLVAGLIILALIGILGMFIANPTGFLQRLAVIGIIGAAIYFVVRLIFFKANPRNKEQRAFLKAAKQSKKRLQKKAGDPSMRSSPGTLASIRKSSKAKKKTSAHLTVIDGKKGKKKNRASF